MSSTNQYLTTGLPGLDEVLKGVLAGDNIVWQIDSIADYQEFVLPYCEAAIRNERRLIYFRFAAHEPLVPNELGAEVHELHPEQGFETFIAEIHSVIEQAGRGAFYVFDCLSILAVDWYSDQMLGNFFMLTCPYLFDLETVTYFALFRNYHSALATDPIRRTTQLFLDVSRHRGELYVRPVKVQYRYSPNMHLLHVQEQDGFRPVTASAVIAEVLHACQTNAALQRGHLHPRELAFIEARSLLEAPTETARTEEVEPEVLPQLLRMLVTQEPRILELVGRHMTLGDLRAIRARMIGTGLIGGKTVGMLMARAILRNADSRFQDMLEDHDSFYIGSDVFYTFLVQNGVWWVRQKQRNPETFLEGAEQARRRILTGRFPDYILQQFETMLDYFGQSPIIVRSSSLLEDNFGNAFAGKYDSVFCANQGPRDRRIEDFLSAVRTIYASTMSERALSYRARRGMLDRDEQMALLVMRVSGDKYGHSFYPPVAGVGFSFNPYVWNEAIDPRAGMVRMVFGLGTRAVDRSDDDYTRLVALNAPDRRPEHNFDEVREYTQRRVDYIDLEANQLVSGHFLDMSRETGKMPIDLFTSVDRSARVAGKPPTRVLTFDKLLTRTPFVKDLRDMLRILHEAYDYPVDVEFTANFTPEGRYWINLVQCRPLQVQIENAVDMPRIEKVRPEDRIMEARGAVIGHGRVVCIDRFIYVHPQAYGSLPVQKRYEIARLIGDLNRAVKGQGTVMLMGPGRWGTSSPSLGVPVGFSDINHVAVLAEIVAMREDLVPDVSLGTHFINELVETDMLYLAIFPEQGDNYIDRAFFEQAPNRLLDFVPTAGKWVETVSVIDVPRTPDGEPTVTLSADAMTQRVVCFRSPH